MRVLIYHPELGGQVLGGAEAVALHLLKTLEEMMLDGKISDITVCSDYDLSPENLSHISRYFGVAIATELYSYKKVTRYKIFHSHLRPYNTFLNTLYKLKDIDCDLYIHTKANSLPLVPMPMAGKLLFYNYLSNIDLSWIGKPQYYPLKQIFKKLYKKVKESTVISSSTYSRYMLLRRLGLDSRVIYPPVDVEHFKWNGEEKRNIAVMAGRISREKKYEQIITGLDKMNIGKLIILGLSQDNEYLTYLKALAMQLDVPLEILLDLPREKYIHILRMAKIYIHACTNEPFGITIPEAMAAGCIPIVPNTGGPAEIVPRELQYGSCDELVEKVNREVENPSFRPGELYSISLKFSKERFYENIKSVITEMIL